MKNSLPRMLHVRQKFPPAVPLNIRDVVQRELKANGVLARIKPKARIAVAVGSRGITNLAEIVAAVVDFLKKSGADPFLIPAMGSHGGATPEGQKEILEGYGVSAKKLKVPMRAAMESEKLGSTVDGIDVFFSVEARHSDGIIVINRVKPHTDFAGKIGSGILKMLVIGLGKRIGASQFHGTASRVGYEPVLRKFARVILQKAPILCGLAIVEDQCHRTARIAVVKPENLEKREEELFAEAKRLMPKLPVEEIELLIVDRIGKNISGAGMDPNIIGRGVHGYSTMLAEKRPSPPVIHRIFVRDLTLETHGNAIGIGLADFTTSRLVNAMDKHATQINALTALTPQGAKIPIVFENDREAIEQAIATLALPDSKQAKVVRIADTLSLESLQISEALAKAAEPRAHLEWEGAPQEMKFDKRDNLRPMSDGRGV